MSLEFFNQKLFQKVREKMQRCHLVQRHAQGSSDKYLNDDHNATRVAANRIGALCRVERVLKSS